MRRENYATAPVAGSCRRQLKEATADATSDEPQPDVNAALIALNASPDPPDGCGRLPPIVDEPYRGEAVARALCYQRAALVMMGYLDASTYGTPGQVGKAAIEELQEALGVVVDGDWGPETNAALSELLGVEMTSTSKGSPIGGPEVFPAPEPVALTVAKAGAGGLGVLAALAAGWWYFARQG